MAARRSFFGESSRLVSTSGTERFRVLRAPPRENGIPSTKAKERDKAPFFSRKRRFAKSGIQPNTFRRNRFPTKRRSHSTDYKHTGGNFVIPRRGGESANLRRKTTQNATDFVLPAEAKKDFSTNDKVSRKMDGTSEFSRRADALSSLSLSAFCGKKLGVFLRQFQSL